MGSRSVALAFALAILALAPGCLTNGRIWSHPSPLSTGSRPRFEGRATISVLPAEQPTGVEVGRLEVFSTGRMEAALNELREQTEAMGGDHVVVESAFTTFEMLTIRDRPLRSTCRDTVGGCSTETRDVMMPVLHLQARVYATEAPR